MSNSRGLLRPDLQRTWVQLDKLPPRSVVMDGFGRAWQSDRGGYWYRAGDGEAMSPFEVAQIAVKVTVLYEGRP